MKKLRMPLSIAIVMGLIATSASGVVAQGDDATAPAFVTGTMVDGGPDFTEIQTEEDGYIRIDIASGPDTWTASDPRLSGEVTYTGTWHRYPAPAAVQVEAGTYELVNEGGRWLGHATAIATATFDGWDTIVFSGEGDYKGLTAYVVIDWVDSPESFTGAIVPDGLPAPPAPATIE